MDLVNFPIQISLCNAYANYLKSGLAAPETDLLIQALDDHQLYAQAAALQTLFKRGEGWHKNIPLLQPWQNSKCYLGALPPTGAELGTLWFDPYELGFMVRILNTPRIGSAGWLGIEPVTQWQYHAFLRLSNIQLKPSYFYVPEDLFARDKLDYKRKYITDIYETEASTYSRWLGKGPANRFMFKAALYFFSTAQVEAIFPQGYSFWDPSLSGTEEERGYYHCDTFRGKSREEGKEDYESIIDSMQLKVCDEWHRDPKVSIIICLSDQLKLTPPDHYPINDEYLVLNNCARKI